LEAATTDYVAILATNYGGHIGFMEGLFPTQYHFSDR
jgi:predicted alpha/beta-fold hydrolase